MKGDKNWLFDDENVKSSYTMLQVKDLFTLLDTNDIPIEANRHELISRLII